MSSTKRGPIVAPAARACDACPWRASNRGRKTSGGWYTLKNIRRLWAGLRSGEAPGMTCHPTDPDNPPTDDGRQAPEGAETKECYGSLLLVAREFRCAEALVATHKGNSFKAYRKLWPKGLTRAGMAHWVMRFVYGGTPFTGNPMPKTYTEDDDIQHPDFDAP